MTNLKSETPAPRCGLTEAECKAIGGHCWKDTNRTLLCDPPMSVQVCKHCGRERHGTPQSPIKWSEP